MSDKMPRTASSQAMQSLFSAYDEDADMDETDESFEAAGKADEPEKEIEAKADVEKIEEEQDPESKEEAANQISGSEDEEENKKVMSAPVQSAPPVKAPSPIMPVRTNTAARRVTKLVSYADGDMNDDDDEDDDDDDPMELETDEEDNLGGGQLPFQIVDYDQTFTAHDLSGVTAVASPKEVPSITMPSGEEVRLPPEPTGKCSKHLQQKIASYHEKMLRTGANLSYSIEKRKDFRNPSIYEKLIHFVDIDEKGTNYPPSLYDSSIWGSNSFYDHLAKLQKEEMDKREKERKEKTKVEFVTATKKQDSGEIKSRRSKWDAQPQGAVGKPPPQVSAAGVNANPTIATVTAAPTGTKATVIPASGALKKPK